ncbi:hypothetical protein AFE_1036 [Acidithiobacillus ferrooxidans ATCC 23270]|uniref:Uncharacterized protein n=1 Tax=Acidithiobacillus ferrooxidans (strain ATCC 23270 / DSM 14882 / CIP 104768 / NCIMB 8455) TaxID=243159 RepID=B7J7L1_ACIF2|nr:hypothetical protein AFE_1036 [Acidithiobacillus ferrooxidans ATCC 23270]
MRSQPHPWRHTKRRFPAFGRPSSYPRVWRHTAHTAVASLTLVLSNRATGGILGSVLFFCQYKLPSRAPGGTQPPRGVLPGGLLLSRAWRHAIRFFSGIATFFPTALWRHTFTVSMARTMKTSQPHTWRHTTGGWRPPKLLSRAPGGTPLAHPLPGPLRLLSRACGGILRSQGICNLRDLLSRACGGIPLIILVDRDISLLSRACGGIPQTHSSNSLISKGNTERDLTDLRFFSGR